MPALTIPPVPSDPDGASDVGPVDRLVPNSVRAVTVEGVDLALVNSEGHLLAVPDLCLRCSRPLSEGVVNGPHLVCSTCGWTYDVEHRCVLGLPALSIETRETRVCNGRVLVFRQIAGRPPGR